MLFTVSISNREIQVQPFAWKHLGFVPDMERMSTAQNKSLRKGISGRGRTCRNYHKCLDVILEDLKGIHRPLSSSTLKPVPMRVRIGWDVQIVHAYLPIAYVIGDNKSNDFLCGKVAGHTLEAPRVTRSCDCPPSQADNPFFRCNPVTLRTVDQAVKQLSLAHQANDQPRLERAERRATKRAVKEAEGVLHGQLYRYYLDNAFSEVWFGRSRYGIHGHTPPDVLHSARKGHMARVLKLVVAAMGNEGKLMLDNQTTRLLCSTRFHARSKFPRTNFPRGFSNLTKLTASETVGCTFSLLLFMLTPQGYALMLDRYTRFFRGQRKANKTGFTEDGVGNFMLRNEEEDEPEEGEAAEEAVESEEEEENTTEEEVDSEEEEEEGDPTHLVDFHQTLNEDDGESPAGSPAPPSPSDEIPLSPEEEAYRKINDIRELLEQMLAFDAWCNHGPFWSLERSREKEAEYRTKIGVMIEHITKTLPRNQGYGWKLQKTHEILHIPEYITKFGHPRNYDSGHGESALKEKAKKPSHTAQKRSYNQFQEQVCQRVDSFQLKSKVHNFLGRLSDREETILSRIRQRMRCQEQLELRQSHTNFEVTNHLRNHLWEMSVHPSTPDKYQFSIKDRNKVDYFPPFAKQQLYEWLKETFPLASYKARVTSFSELVRERRDNGRLTDQQLFRAHFNYHSDGSWYDWVLTTWESEDSNSEASDPPQSTSAASSSPTVLPTLSPPSDNGLYPAKILAFFQIELEPFGNASTVPPLTEHQKEHLIGEGTLDTNPLCLLHCTNRRQEDTDDSTGDSSLTCKFDLEYSNDEAMFRVAPVSIIEKQCFVIENLPGVHEVVLEKDSRSVRYVADRESEWGRLF